MRKLFKKAIFFLLTTMAALMTLVACGGEQKLIEFQAANGYIQWRYEGENIWKNILSLDELERGDNGKSAYEIAVENGFTGTEEEWLETLKGQNGEAGKSAYEIAVENGFTGTEEQWLAALSGQNGATGKSAYEIAVENGFTGTEEQWLAALVGQNGATGKSAYELAVENGFKGTEEQWLASLKGENGATGKSAYEIAVEKGYKGTESQWLESLKGAKGDDGKSVYEIAKSLGFKGTEAEWLESLKGVSGDNGYTPTIGENGNWWIGDTDTGIAASGGESENMDGTGTDGLYFQMTIRGGVAGYEVVGYSGTESDIVIPNKIFGKPVVSIKQGALPSNMTSLKISSNTEYLPTFQDYDSLIEVDLNHAPITGFVDNAFKNSDSLSSLKNYENITTIGSYAFYGTSIWSFDFSNIVSIGTYAFYDIDDDFLDAKIEQMGLNAYLQENNLFYYIPKTVTSIGTYAFYDDDLLPVYYEGSDDVEYSGTYFYTSVQHDSDGYYYRDMGTYASLLNYDGSAKRLVVPATLGGKPVQSVEKYAFLLNARVERVALPSSVKSIGTYAFAYNLNLHSLFIPDSVTACGSYIARYDDDLGVSEVTTVFFEETEFNLDGGITDVANLNISKYMVGVTPGKVVDDSTCVYLAKTLSYQIVTIKQASGVVDIPSTYNSLPVTQINKYAFLSNNQASVVNISKNITDIAKYAFYGNSTVRIINIPNADNDVNQYGFYSLSNCTIFVEASARPENWDSSWYSSVGEIVYGSKGLYGKTTDGVVYLYEIVEGKVYLKKYLGTYTTGMTLSVPDKIDGKTVYGVRGYCYDVTSSVYSNSSTRLKIVIPSTITVMEYAAINCYTSSYYCYADIYLSFASSSEIPTTWNSNYIYRRYQYGTIYYSASWEMVNGVPTAK